MEWDNNRQSVIATLTNGRVIVSKDRDFDTVIEIEDEELNTLEAINTGYTVYSDLASEANEFYEVARRSALKIDSKIESIIGKSPTDQSQSHATDSLPHSALSYMFNCYRASGGLLHSPRLQCSFS